MQDTSINKTVPSADFVFNPQKLLDDMVTFVAVLDTSGTIIFVNNTPLNAVGITLEDIVKRNPKVHQYAVQKCTTS